VLWGTRGHESLSFRCLEIRVALRAYYDRGLEREEPKGLETQEDL
jgi:hypothetical protein